MASTDRQRLQQLLGRLLEAVGIVLPDVRVGVEQRDAGKVLQQAVEPRAEGRVGVEHGAAHTAGARCADNAQMRFAASASGSRPSATSSKARCSFPTRATASRTTDYLNAHDSDFIALIDADVRWADGSREPERQDYLAISARHVILVTELESLGVVEEPNPALGVTPPTPLAVVAPSASSASATAASTSAPRARRRWRAPRPRRRPRSRGRTPGRRARPRPRRGARARSSTGRSRAPRSPPRASTSALAAGRLRELERGLRVGPRAQLRADDHHDLRRQEALAQQAAAGLADRLAEARRPQVLDQHDGRVLALADLLGQAPQVLQREARGAMERLLRGRAAVAAAVRAQQVRDWVRRFGRVGEQRVEVDLGELAVLARDGRTGRRSPAAARARAGSRSRARCRRGSARSCRSR